MDRTQKFWDRIAKQWDQQGSQLDQTSVQAIESTKKYLDTGDIAFDYGCGIGTITNKIAENVKEIYAIDISLKMIEVAARIAGEREIENVTYAQSSIFDERLNPETFNVITAFNILHLVEDTPLVVRRINALLQPGGMFISTTACLGEKRSVLGFL